MSIIRPEHILAELTRLPGGSPDPTLQAVRTALLIEDIFRITLTDNQIDLAVLGDLASLHNIVDAPTPPR